MTPSTTKILLVEDNPGDARLLQEAFEEITKMRFQFILCKTLKEALECLADGRPDVCLLDLGLPDAQGLEAVQNIRRESPDLPIVVLTVLNDETLALQALHEGAQHYLAKGNIAANTLCLSPPHPMHP